MIDASIRTTFQEKHGELNFRGLLAFMESTGIPFKERGLRWQIGIATPRCIYIDFIRLSKFNDKITFFIVLHEIAHFKRIAKMTIPYMVEMLSNEDFEEFCSSIINEEIIADRYGCLLYKHFNQQEFPRAATQQLHLLERQLKYRATAYELYGTVKHSEENWINLLDSFLE